MYICDLSVPDEGNSRNASCGLNLIFTFSVFTLFIIALFLILFVHFVDIGTILRKKCMICKSGNNRHDCNSIIYKSVW